MISEAAVQTIVRTLADTQLSGRLLRRRAMELLDGMDSYNWSGVYRLEGEELILDEYVGAATDHVRIPIGVGVCGSAVAEDRNQVIDDVRELTNYLSCSAKTRSEIVVLIKKDGKTLGQIDIDGHQVGAFDATDEAFLEQVAAVLSARWD